jgi:heptosyltransferase III
MIKNKKCAVFSCLGLGDGLIALVLSHNLKRNDNEVITFHPSLSQLQRWFPSLPIKPFPSGSEIVEALHEIDHFFIVFEKTTWMQEIISFCQRNYPEKACIINPIATPNRDYPYWENARFDGRLPFVDNLYSFCREILQLSHVTKSNGIAVPADLILYKNPSKVILHPSSSRPGKNWPKEKYLQLAKRLECNGYDPIFILSKEERAEWADLKVNAPLFSSLSEVAACIYEAGYMIGNDSGIGHLASCLGVPTVTICRNQLTAQFWRPNWAAGSVIFPSPLIPNLKGFRLRDKYWKSWVSLNSVFNRFLLLTKDAS